MASVRTELSSQMVEPRPATTNGRSRARGMSSPPDVAVLIETSTTWGSSIARGIGRYAAEHGPWLIFLEPRGRKESLTIPPDWRGDGIIARINHPELAEQIKAIDVPAVDCSWFPYGDGPRIARVTSDEQASGRMAARHLLDRGLQHFGAIPPHDRPGYTDLVSASFAESIRDAGFRCSVFDVEGTRYRDLDWREKLDVIAGWITSMPRPAGIISFSDVHARKITEACRLHGIEVPQEVAIISAEQDELSSLISIPPLSSIDPNGERVGYAAAERLDAMMRGGPIPRDVLRIPPAGVIARQSTDMLAVEDPILRRVCEYIREHAFEPIRVEDLLDQAHTSRRVLERKFMRTLNRSPAATIRRIRIERAKQLLFDTALSVTEIAARTGFGKTDAMARAFRSEFDMTPSEFRRRSGIAEPE